MNFSKIKLLAACLIGTAAIFAAVSCGESEDYAIDERNYREEEFGILYNEYQEYSVTELSNADKAVADAISAHLDKNGEGKTDYAFVHSCKEKIAFEGRSYYYIKSVGTKDRYSYDATKYIISEDLSEMYTVTEENGLLTVYTENYAKTDLAGLDI